MYGKVHYHKQRWMSTVKNEYLRVFRAFSDENRVRILELLCSGEQCACVLLEDMEISQPTLSHHLKILCDSGIVKSRRAGKWNYYSINKDGCKYASRLLNIIAQRKLTATLNLIGMLYNLFRALTFRPISRSGSPASCRCSK